MKPTDIKSWLPKKETDEERAARELAREKNYGGYRTADDGKRYWLNSKQITEFEEVNAKIEKDEDFWAWFKDFREKHKLWGSLPYTPKRGSVIWTPGEDDEYSWKGTKGGSLSEWWTGYGKSSYAWAGTGATKLALAMSAIRTVIRVIDDSDPPMSVHWAEMGASYTDFRGSKIFINPQPMKDEKLTEGQAIDISTAWGMHEASHAMYTKPIWDFLLKPTPLQPITIATLMGNLAEDIRIERLTAEKFPGFADYFAKGLEYLWGKSGGTPPAAYGPGLQDKVNFAIAAVKWPLEAEKLWGTTERAELDWWKDWAERYFRKVDIRAFAQEAITHLRIATEKEKADGESDEKGEGADGESDEKGEGKAAEEMDEMAAKEKEAAERLGAWERFVERIDEFMKKMGFKPTEFCSHPEAEDGLEPDESRSVERMVTEELRKEECPVKMPTGSFKPEVYVSKPEETTYSRQAYIGKPNPVLARLKAALLFRQELPQFANRLQREGNLDEEELWRWTASDYRVFEEKVVAVHPKVQMSLLVDLSGSMIGRNLTTAQELAQLFVWALRDMQNVTTKVFGHTANVKSSNDCQVYRLWEPGDPMSRIGLVASLPHQNNYDGYAIASVVQEILTRGEETEQRVVIVLADGYPAGYNYGGGPGMKHVKAVDDWARKQGVEVIQIAIDSDLDPARQSAMFKRWIPYTTTQALPRVLEQLLAKLT